MPAAERLRSIANVLRMGDRNGIISGENHLAGENNAALRAWRGIFVLLLVVLGGYSGFKLGALLVGEVANIKSNNMIITTYRDLLSHNSAANTFAPLTVAALGALVVFLVATGIFNRLVRVGDQLKEMRADEKIANTIGVILGLLVTLMLSPLVLQIQTVGWLLTFLLAITFVYLGTVLMSSMKDDIWRIVSSEKGQSASSSGPETKPELCKILDTNVIIDGRVADICRTGFLEGPIYVPGFVLDELQHIADSSDGLKRARGRRGLDILNQMRTELKMMVRTYDNTDPNDRDEVDAKLVKLAHELGGVIVTNDFNLNKVAELQGVKVLNINELANALKPVVLPGEEMTVTIIKEGKEINQGVAYLDDGTMIVVEGARRHIGETLDVVTSSVLQTVAGKMIFASIRNPQDGDYDEESYDQRLRNYPRGGPRRKIQH